MTMLTKNTDKLRHEVAAHVAADSITQHIYWDEENQRGCFIGCLAHSDNPKANEAAYGLPVMVQRIAENIFEALPEGEAKAFFAAIPDAVGCDGKNLSKVGWQFLAAELRALPPVPAEVQSAIDPVIDGMERLVEGIGWAADDAAWAAANAAKAAAWAAKAAAVVPDAAWAAANAAKAAADAADAAAVRAAARVASWAALAAGCAACADADAAADAAAVRAAARAAAWSARAVACADADDDAACDAADAARSAAAVGLAARARQRDLLLRLIAEAPVELSK